MTTKMLALTTAALLLGGVGYAMDHGNMDHGSMGEDAKQSMEGMDHSEHMGELIHQSTVDGYKLAYHLIDNKAQMAKMDDHKGMSMGDHGDAMKSHHLMVFVVGPDGSKVTGGKVGYLVEGPAGEQKAMAMGMKGGFGSDVDLAPKGAYEIKTKFMAGGKTLMDKFTYHAK